MEHPTVRERPGSAKQAAHTGVIKPRRAAKKHVVSARKTRKKKKRRTKRKRKRKRKKRKRRRRKKRKRKKREVVECKDKKSAKYCTKRKGKGYCTNKKKIKKMKKVCAKTCGFCTESDKKEDKEEDEKDDSSGDLKSDFQAAVLKAHNDYRAKHSTGAMTWSKAAEEFAQKWCDKLAKENKMYHSTYPERDNMGENLYMQSWAPDADIGANTVKSWYDEESLWDYSKDAYQSGAGHFTQVVWKGSTEVGCAYAYKSSTFVCCNYNPAGNSGAYKANVGKKN